MIRLDVFLVRLGLAKSRTQAAALIAQNKVSVVPGLKSASPLKASTIVDPSVHVAELTIPPSDGPYGHGAVSRAAVKLRAALDCFCALPHDVRIADIDCIDVGASTGGFTHELLRRGARSVVAIDVGTNQLDETLRSDPRVRSLENTDIRTVDVSTVAPSASLAVVDVSFLSLAHVLPCLSNLERVIALVKPQYEIGHLGLRRMPSRPDSTFYKSILQLPHFTSAHAFMFPQMCGKDGMLEFFGLWYPKYRKQIGQNDAETAVADARQRTVEQAVSEAMQFARHKS